MIRMGMVSHGATLFYSKFALRNGVDSRIDIGIRLLFMPMGRRLLKTMRGHLVMRGKLGMSVGIAVWRRRKTRALLTCGGYHDAL